MLHNLVLQYGSYTNYSLIRQKIQRINIQTPTLDFHI
jgi:hypothetical protein